MQKWVIDAIEGQARALRNDPEASGAGFPLLVFGALRKNRPEVIEHIRRHKPGVDPYQVVASHIPRQG